MTTPRSGTAISCSWPLVLACICVAWGLSSNLAGSAGIPASEQDTVGTEGRTIKEIRIEGARRTKDFVIHRELRSRVGSRYEERTAKEDVERLDRLRLFSSIQIIPIQTPGGVVLEIRVREIYPYFPAPSIDVNDQTGFSGGIGFKALNLFGRGLFLGTSARFGGSTELEVIAEDPWIAGNHISPRVEYSYRERVDTYYDFGETSSELHAQLGSHVGNSGRIGGRFGFLALESDRPEITLSSSGKDQLRSLALYAGYDSRDLASNPTDGWWAEIEGGPSGGALGGDGNFWLWMIDVRRFQPLGERHTLMMTSLTRFRTGTLGEAIPTYLSYQLGGANTIRGWSLDARRGKSEMINSVEYLYSLMKPRPLSLKGLNLYLGIRLAAFTDFGIAWTDSRDFNSGNWIAGAGVGIRLLVPFIEVIRFDLACGQPGEGIHSHVGIAWKADRQRPRVR